MLPLKHIKMYDTIGSLWYIFVGSNEEEQEITIGIKLTLSLAQNQGFLMFKISYISLFLDAPK